MKNGFVVGLVMGTVVGAAVGAIIDPIKDKQNRAMQHKTTRVFRTIGNIVNSMVD